ncbi:MAG: hypothetical protein AAGH99_03270 [Planctomycetota bacterium]
MPGNNDILLVIDDDPTVLGILQNTTAAFPFECHGFTGPAALLANKPDPRNVACILLDKELDCGIDGIELMPLFEREYATAPVIVMGNEAFSWPQTLRYVVEGHAYATWDKTRNAVDLWNLVQSAMAVHLKRTERFRQRKWEDIHREEIEFAFNRNRAGTLDDVAADLGLSLRQLRYQMRKHDLTWLRSA